jgi:phospholipase C
MDSRRDFLKKAALLAAGGGVAGGFPASIQRALAIDPAPGSTWLDAEHVVILMQENRSFDHCYGALRGVRGFNDPRAVTLPDGNPVWLQTNRAGETYAPFRLNIKDTKATWIGSLPHSWADQTDARNGGRHDGWLDAKPSGHRECGHLPLTLGFYNREDIPFYYAFADAFTVCDQNFCSSLTGTTPNRLHLFTGTIRERPSIEAKANVRNEDVDYGAEASWTTFPERLEEHGISWRIYQNEVSLPIGLEGEAEAWLANFSDNPIEWFTQYHVRFAVGYRLALPRREKALTEELAGFETQARPWPESVQKRARAAREELAHVRQEQATWTEAAFAKLPAREQNLHRKAFTTNDGDPHYHELTSLTYRDGTTERTLQVPKGDVLHQFRQDVRTGRLPAVSWIVAPENFSDHPSAPWYGAWYLSECLDILTQNPEVWRKTIFVLCYDENDGYFDHVPPFVPPNPERPESGKVSAGIDSSVEQVRMVQEDERAKLHPGSAKRAGPIGLGFRVPLVIASPWSRGGYVNSQVCDHTSIIQMTERLLSHRTGKAIRENNISAWRRTVCGDLSSVFRPYYGEKLDLPPPVQRDSFLGSIHRAQFKQMPDGFHRLSAEDIALSRTNPQAAPWLPRQEDGIRPSCALPYQLLVDGQITSDRKSFEIHLEALKWSFGERCVGAPFHVYAPGKVRAVSGSAAAFESGRTWAYAVSAGDRLTDAWALADFAEERYHLRVHGPNGFFREFAGSAADPALEITIRHLDDYPFGQAGLRLRNHSSEPLAVEVADLGYGQPRRTIMVAGNGPTQTIPLQLERSHGWYDFGLTVSGAPAFVRSYAGRIEAGRDGFSDPLMGRVVV